MTPITTRSSEFSELGASYLHQAKLHKWHARIWLKPTLQRCNDIPDGFAPPILSLFCQREVDLVRWQIPGMAKITVTLQILKIRNCFEWDPDKVKVLMILIFQD